MSSWRFFLPEIYFAKLIASLCGLIIQNGKNLFIPFLIRLQMEEYICLKDRPNSNSLDLQLEKTNPQGEHGCHLIHNKLLNYYQQCDTHIQYWE